MANGESCKFCGWQEADHLERNIHRCDPNHKRLPGYRRSLICCVSHGGFVSENPEPEMSGEEFRNYCEGIEKQGEARFAWGYYAATMRDLDFKEKIREFDREIRTSRFDKYEASARARKEAYLEECRSANGIWIG